MIANSTNLPALAVILCFPSCCNWSVPLEFPTLSSKLANNSKICIADSTSKLLNKTLQVRFKSILSRLFYYNSSYSPRVSANQNNSFSSNFAFTFLPLCLYSCCSLFLEFTHPAPTPQHLHQPSFITFTGGFLKAKKSPNWSHYHQRGKKKEY